MRAFFRFPPKAFQATRLRSQKSSVAGNAEVEGAVGLMVVGDPPKGGSDEPLAKKNGGEVPDKKRFHEFLGSMFRGGKR